MYSDLKYPHNTIWILNSKYSYCADETLHFDKFEGADFKYFLTPFQKYSKKTIFTPDLTFNTFNMKHCFSKNSKVVIFNMTIVFFTLNVSKPVNLCFKHKVSSFYMKLCIIINLMMVISNATTVLDFWNGT